MAKVTFGRNTPTPYDIRMEGIRARPSAPSLVNPASRSTQTPVGQVGGLMQNLANASLLGGLLYNAGVAWKGFSKTPQGQLLTDRVGETLSAPGRFLNSALGGNNPLPSFGGNAPRLTQFNPPGFDPNKPVTGADLAQSAQAVSRYSPAAERAYQGEVFRTAQLAAQSPEMLAYADQREKDLKSKDYSKSEDMGMRIWAQKYGPGSKNDLASKVKPGQAGYDVIQEVIKGKAAPSAAGPTAMGYNPFAINTYSTNFKLPGMEEYANSMPGSIVRAPGIMPSYAMDNPMQGDYNSTVNQTYNLSFPIVPTTTVNTNSAAMGAALYTPNSSVQAMGNFAGPPIKLPIGNTPFGATGYQAFTAGSLLPNLTREQIYGPKAEGKFNAMFSANR